MTDANLIPYAAALFALKDLNKTSLGRILRPITYDLLTARYPTIKWQTQTWMHQAQAILASPVAKTAAAVEVLQGEFEAGKGQLHMDHQPSIKVLKEQIAAASSETDVLMVLRNVDFAFMTPQENYAKGGE